MTDKGRNSVGEKMRLMGNKTAHNTYLFPHMAGYAALLTALLFMFAACVQTAIGAPIGTTERQIEAYLKDLERIEQSLKSPNMSRAEIERFRVQLEDIHTKTTRLNNDVTPEIEGLANRLRQLAPETDAQAGTEEEAVVKESENVTRERENLTKQLARLENAQKQLEFLAVSARQFSDAAATRQREIFFDNIFQPAKSIVNPSLWIEGLMKMQPFIVRIGRLGEGIVSRLDFSSWHYIALCLGFALSFLFAFPLRRWVMHFGAPRETSEWEGPDQLQRLWRVTWSPIATFLSFLPLMVSGGLFIDATSDVHYQFSQLTLAILASAIMFFVFSSLVRAILSPANAAWRLVDLTDKQSRTLFWFLRIILLIFVFTYFIEAIALILFFPVELVVLHSVLASFLTMFTLGTALLAIKPTYAETDEDGQDNTADTNPTEEATARPRAGFYWVARSRLLLWLIIFITISALLFGYIALAGFIAKQLITTALLIVVLYLLHHLFDELIDTGFRRDRTIGRFLRYTLGCSTRIVDNLGILLGVLSDIALIFIGVPLIVIQWAVTWVDIKSWILTLFLGFKIGDVDISLLTVVILIAALVAGLTIARIFSRWIDKRVLKKTQMKRGLRDSLRTGVRYVGIGAAVTFALFVSGVDFSNIAIIAGALSIGIGFGLQSIVNNFVSGLILLAERPIKVGDWISVSGGEGYVQQINVRSTEIQTFDRCSVIVPNSTLISETVSNWTHADTMGRLRINVGVAYDSDPQQVREILLECARNHQLILAYPQPVAYLVNFGDSALDFSLRGYIADVNYTLSVSSDLRFAIYAAFKQAGVEIPFPQTDIHIRSGEAINDTLAQTDDPAPNTKKKA